MEYERTETQVEWPESIGWDESRAATNDRCKFDGELVQVPRRSLSQT